MLGGKHGNKIPNSITYLITNSWISTYIFFYTRCANRSNVAVYSDCSGGQGSEKMDEGVRSEKALVQGPMMAYQNGRSRIHSLVCAWVKKKSNKMKGNRIWKFRHLHSTLASPLLLSSPLVPFLCSEGNTEPLKSPPFQDSDIKLFLWAQ